MNMFYQMADVVVTRSGSNAIIEGLLLGKRMICIPLSASASRGEQMLNAKFAKKNGTAVIIDDKECNISVFLEALYTVLRLPENHSYKITKKKLLEQIQHHVNGIYQVAFEQLQHDIEKHLKCGKKINLQDFSECEMGILDDLSSNYDL
jgi:UDP-N-acetylglucosamine--N-acetylmuramyl-(pentapeptide) pyrophosphoryl-undecaprenol N-acetylglucosamine transferase